MADLLEQLAAAADWPAYHQVYTAFYREVAQARWALGRATFANQLHHTAIPDASGATVGTVRWAAYSQPSSATLAAFLSVFASLLEREPHRIRANRYLFFVPTQPSLPFPDGTKALGAVGDRLDFWIGSLAEGLAWPLEAGPLQSINILFARGVPIVSQPDAASVISAVDKPAALAELKQHLLAAQAPPSSTVAPAIRRGYLESAFILTAGRLGLSPDQTIAICKEQAGIAACIAADRAAASGWPREVVDFCTTVLAKAPPATWTYTVSPGDILTRLVRHFYEQSFESLWPLIKVLNPQIKDPNLIGIGQKIRFPVLGPHPAPIA